MTTDNGADGAASPNASPDDSPQAPHPDPVPDPVGFGVGEKLAAERAEAALLDAGEGSNVVAEVALLRVALDDPAAAEMLTSGRVPRDAFTGTARTACRDALADLAAGGHHAPFDAATLLIALQKRLPKSLDARHVVERLRCLPGRCGETDVYVAALRDARFKRLAPAIRQSLAKAFLDDDRPAADALIKQLDDLRPAAGFAEQFATGCDTAATLLNEDDDEPDWLIEDGLMFRGGTTILVAPSKVGKSLVATALSVDLVAKMIVEGHVADFLGSKIVGRGPVLYLSAEGGRRLLRKRIRKMTAHLCGSPDVLKHLITYTGKPRPDLTNPDDVRAVYEFAKSKGCVLVVWDPLGRFWPIAGEDENLAKPGRDLMDLLEECSVAANVATLLVHHDTKTSGNRGNAVSAGRGTGRLMDDVDCAVINLKIDEKDRTDVKAYFVTRDGPHIPPRQLAIDPDTLYVRVVADKTAAPSNVGGAPRGEFGKAILEALTKEPGSRWKRQQLMDKVGVKDARTFTSHWRDAVDLAKATTYDLVENTSKKPFEYFARPHQPDLEGIDTSEHDPGHGEAA